LLRDVKRNARTPEAQSAALDAKHRWSAPAWKRPWLLQYAYPFSACFGFVWLRLQKPSCCSVKANGDKRLTYR